MPLRSLQLEDLLALAEELRHAGFDLSTQQYIAAQNLLIALAAHGKLPNDPHDLQTWLAPIFCSSPKEQEDFYQRFQLWLARNPEVGVEIDPVTVGAVTTPTTTEQTKRKWSERLRQPLWLTMMAALILLLATVVLLTKSTHQITGQVFSAADRQPIAGASIVSASSPVTTDEKGQFAIAYQISNLDYLRRNQLLRFSVEATSHETKPVEIEIPTDENQQITLRKIEVAPPQKAPEKTTPQAPTVAVTPIPILTGIPTPAPTASSSPVPTPPVSTTEKNDWLRWLAVVAPFLLFACWWAWQKLRQRLFLQKLQAYGTPRINRITVKGVSEQLFQGAFFRRVVQELRRHRHIGVRDLDIVRTVRATLRKGGLFTPAFGTRQALPEYLLLIDRASAWDEQARVGDEIFARLEAGSVFIERYYFQGDPRTCRKPGSPTFSLPDLAARHPDHHLLIFSDGTGLLSPLTGEPEPWLNLFSGWSNRILLTPETVGHWGYREWSLSEHDFTILPVNRDGLTALIEWLSTGAPPRLNGQARHAPLPEIVQERPKRWLERHAPAPAVAQRLARELKNYLGAEGWHWLCACAVYPALHWDLTLYLGYQLLGQREDFEERLLALVRLPWFRYGTMPDWWREQLIASLSPEQEAQTRRWLETLLLSSLENPSQGAQLEFAQELRTEKSGWRNAVNKLAQWLKRQRLRAFIRNAPPDSPLRDYVFLSFLAGRKPRRLDVNVPDLLRRLLFPQGQSVLGLRPVTALVLAACCAAAIWPLVFKAPSHEDKIAQVTPTPTPAPTPLQFYQQMSEAEQIAFVKAQAERISETMSNDKYAFSDEAVKAIKPFVDAYAQRVGNKSTARFREDLNRVMARGIAYAPTISQEFQQQSLSPVLGWATAMINSEFDPCRTSAVGAKGMFQILAPVFISYGVDPKDRCDVRKSAQVATRYLKDRIREFGSDAKALSLVIASYNRAPTNVQRDLTSILSSYPSDERSFWTLLKYQQLLDRYFGDETAKYVPNFFAAAIVGENPQSFRLDMQTLSSYTEINAEQDLGQVLNASTTETKNPVANVSISPTTRTTRGCQDETTLVRQGGYKIRSIKAINEQGQIFDLTGYYPLGPLFEGKPLASGSTANVKAEADGLLKTNKIDPQTVAGCLQIVTTRDCPKCVDVILTASSTTTTSGISVLLPESGKGYITRDRDPGGANQYGLPSTIRAIEDLAAAWASKHPDIPLSVGDISRQGGSAFPNRQNHKEGREFDLRPIRNDGQSGPTQTNAPNYSRELTRELILLVKQMFPAATIIFSDQALVAQKLAVSVGGHSNHIHIGLPK